MPAKGDAFVSIKGKFLVPATGDAFVSIKKNVRCQLRAMYLFPLREILGAI